MLTVTEREHWRQQIARRIQKKITRIEEANKPALSEIKKQARENAMVELGIVELDRKRRVAGEQVKRFEREEKKLTKEIVAQLRGVDASEIEASYQPSLNTEIEGAITKRQSIVLEKLYQSDDVGRELLKLEREKENLLDTVWLATSTAQVKELWKKLTALLGDDETQLQKEAIEIQPVAD